MENLSCKFRLDGNALPPQAIQLDVPGWGGSPDFKRQNGSEPQPWHCAPFVDAATCGLELLYPFEIECHVVNDNGQIRFDFENGPADPATPKAKFGVFAPSPPQFYAYGTGVDIQAPAGCVLRTQPHPRFFTDKTGTVPIAVCGHVQTEWWSKKLFLVFKVPPPGQRHIFRKGEPFVQILFVPQKVAYEIAQMTPEETEARSFLEESVEGSATYISKNVWHNPEGSPYRDYYRVLARSFARDGIEGVKQTAQAGVEARQAALPGQKTLPQILELALSHQKEGNLLAARDIYLYVMRVQPEYAEAKFQFGNVADAMGLPQVALTAMSEACRLQPQSADYRVRLAEVLRGLGRFKEAEPWLRSALQLKPGDPHITSLLAMENG